MTSPSVDRTKKLLAEVDAALEQRFPHETATMSAVEELLGPKPPEPKKLERLPGENEFAYLQRSTNRTDHPAWSAWWEKSKQIEEAISNAQQYQGQLVNCSALAPYHLKRPLPLIVEYTPEFDLYQVTLDVRGLDYHPNMISAHSHHQATEHIGDQVAHLWHRLLEREKRGLNPAGGENEKMYRVLQAYIGADKQSKATTMHARH